MSHRGLLGAALACALLTLGGGAGAGIALGDPPTGQPASAVVTTGPELDKDATIARLAAAAEAEQSRVDAQIASPEGRARQHASETEFAGLGEADARGLMARTFPDLVRAPVWEPLKLTDDQTVTSYPQPNSAKVDQGPGEPDLVAESTLPLRARDESGALRPVDLEIEKDGDSFKPANPITDVTLPESGDEPIEVGGVVSLNPATSTGPGRELDDRVFYPGGDTDIDYLVGPAPTGAELVAQIRSPRAAEDIPLGLTGLGGATIQLNSSTGNVDVEKDGKVIATIKAPAAFDANLRTVPSEYRVKDDDIVLHVAHHDSGATYPIAADPLTTIIDEYRIYASSGQQQPVGDPFEFWSYTSNNTANFSGQKNTAANSQQGLFVFAAANKTYSAAAYGEWVYSPPSNDVYIERVDFGYVGHNITGSCALEGIYALTRGTWDAGSSRDRNGTVEPSPVIDCNPLTGNYRAHCVGTHNRTGNANCVPHADNDLTDPVGTGGNQAVFGLYMQTAGLRTQTHAVDMYGATVWMYDDFPPAINTLTHKYKIGAAAQTAGVPTAWIDSTILSDNALIDDRGLGDVYFNIYANGSLVVGITRACAPGAAKFSRCYLGQWATPAVNYSTANLPQGTVAMSAKGIDAVSQSSTPFTWTLKVDTLPPAKPTVTASATSVSSTGTLTATVKATDPHSGVKSMNLLVDGVATTVPVWDRGCTNPNCGTGEVSHDFVLDIASLNLSYGSHTLTATAADALAHPSAASDSVSFTVKDVVAPGVTLAGGLAKVPASDRNLDITATDTGGVGVKSLEVFLLDGGAQPSTANRVFNPTVCPGGTSCPTAPGTQTYTLASTVTAGEHDLLVRATDAADNVTDKRITIFVVDLRRGDPGRLGLEQWFDYDETPAGGGSNVYVNADTGNAVWNQLPIADPGRGLSTVVNLTYNSQDRGGLLGTYLGKLPVVDLAGTGAVPFADDLLDASYGEVGPGFSLGISGPVRVNEPLRGVLYAQLNEEGVGTVPGGPQVTLPTGWSPEIVMTDADGTRHKFTRGTSPTSAWQSPPGVDLRLRRFAVDPPGTTPLTSPVTKKWAMTRQDGVTYFFDSLGYLTSIEDRNGNKTTYAYASYNALIGGTTACGASDLLGLLSTVKVCARRLKTVTDPAGRTMTINYVGEGTNSNGLVPSLIDNVIAGLPTGVPGLLGGKPGRIASIADGISGRTYAFTYDPTDGFLTSFTEASNETDVGKQRVTKFEYEDWKPGLHLGQDRLLTAVVEMEKKPGDDVLTERARTTVGYESAAGVPAVLGVNQPRKATSLTERDGTPKTFEYPRTTTTSFKVTERASAAGTSPGGRTLAATNLVTLHKVDSAGKPIDVTDPNSTVTHLEWDNTINQVTAVVDASSSTPDQSARTEYEYDKSHQFPVLRTKRTYPKYPTTTEKRETVIGYDWSAGVPSLQSSVASVGDSSASFVADMTSITRPKAGTGWTFGLEPGNTGNVTSRTDAKGRSSYTTYTKVTDPDQPPANGLIRTEKDENNDLTTYSDWHATGQPQTVVKPTEDGKPVGYRTWTYRFNGVGDVVAVVDPRAGADAAARSGAAGNNYTTALTYDAFDRVLSVESPKKSIATPDAPREFLTRSFTYDRNGNVTRQTDANGKSTSVEYTKIDEPKRVTSPGSSDGGTRTTGYAYDDAGRLVARVDPLGASTDAALGTLALGQRAACEQDERTTPTHVTGYCLDLAGRRVATLRYDQTQTAASKQRVLVDTYAFDRRDNLLGNIDAKRNAARTIPDAIAAAQTESNQQQHYDYDRVDEQIASRRRPSTTDGGTIAGPYEQTYDYDANGNLRFIHDPRNTAWTIERKYDHRDQVIATLDQLGQQTCVARRKDGSVLAVTTPRGTASDKSKCTDSINPDDLGSLYKEFTTVYSYDHVGDVVGRSVPYVSGQYKLSDDKLKKWKVTYIRDAVGNPTKIYDARTNARTSSPEGDAAEITNTFYDTGELLSTNRPSYWQASYGGQSPIPSAGNRYTASDDADTDVAVGGPTLVERDGRSANANAGAGDLPSGTGDLGDVSPQSLPGLLPQAGLTTFAYDNEMRLTKVTDAAGKERGIEYYDDGAVKRKRWPFKLNDSIRHTFAYDADGNLTSSTIQDPLSAGATGVDAVSTFTYDGHDRLTQMTQPGARTAPSVPAPITETTNFGYDQNGNLLTRETPRGSATATADDYTLAYTYDGLDRLQQETNPAGERYLYGYDQADQLIAELSPLGQTAAAADKELYRTDRTYDPAQRLATVMQKVDDHPTATTTSREPLTTTFSYDDDGNQTKIVAPGAKLSSNAASAADRITETTFDGRGLPWKRTVGTGTDPDATSSARRTSITEFDPNGNLRRSVSPRGVNQTTLNAVADDDGTDMSASLDTASEEATVNTYDKDDLLISTRLPWNSQDTRKFRTDIQRTTDPISRPISIISPYETSSTNAPRVSYTYLDSDWIRTVSNEKTTKAGTTAPVTDRSVTYDYDHRGDQTLWLTAGYPASNRSRRISRTYYPNGLTSTRVAEKPNADDDGDVTQRSYSYYYDENRTLTTFNDQQLNRRTDITRDGAERQLNVDETWPGGRDTVYAYDGAGNNITRKTDGIIDTTPAQYGGADQKTTTFSFDSLNREWKAVVHPAAGLDRTTLTRWWNSGEMRQRVKPSGTTDDWYWTSRGSKAAHTRTPSAAGVAATTVTYKYDPNENRTQDERGTYDFDARDGMVKWTRPTGDGRPKAGYVTTYTRRGDGSLSQTVERNGATATETVGYEYDGDGERLRRTKTTINVAGLLPVTNTTTYDYNYFNSVVKVTSQLLGGILPSQPADDTPPPKDCNPDDTVGNTLKAGQTLYCYDEFERQTFTKGYGVDEPATITYDGLDRRDTKTTRPLLGSPSPHDYSYIGTSELLTRESTKNSSGTVTKQQTYDYDSQGARQGASTAEGSATTFHAYNMDANGSVIGLENAGGDIPDNQKYFYDPYGELERRSALSTDAEGELAGDAKSNAFRFEGFYYDSGVKTYDMQARAYRPDIGQFLSQDQFESAIGDQVLQSDALTQNRYAFAGGNPVTNVEFDGHEPVSSFHNDATYCGNNCDGGKTNPAERTEAIASNQRRNSDARALYNRRLQILQMKRQFAAEEAAEKRELGCGGGFSVKKAGCRLGKFAGGLGNSAKGTVESLADPVGTFNAIKSDPASLFTTPLHQLGGCLSGTPEQCGGSVFTGWTIAAGGSAARAATRRTTGLRTRYRKGVPVALEGDLDWALSSPAQRAATVVEKYGINLRGSGQDITVRYNENLPFGKFGRVRAMEPNVIEFGKTALASEEDLATTIAHELRHARAYLGSGSNSERAARRSEAGMRQFMRGGR